MFPGPADLSLCFSAWPCNHIQVVSQAREGGPHSWLSVSLTGASPHTREMRSSGVGWLCTQGTCCLQPQCAVPEAPWGVGLSSDAERGSQLLPATASYKAITPTPFCYRQAGFGWPP